jgi:hypothetical protein
MNFRVLRMPCFRAWVCASNAAVITQVAFARFVSVRARLTDIDHPSLRTFSHRAKPRVKGVRRPTALAARSMRRSAILERLARVPHAPSRASADYVGAIPSSLLCPTCFSQCDLDLLIRQGYQIIGAVRAGLS